MAESLASARPDLVAQWDHARNGDLSPDDVSRSSGRRVWWVCSIADDHMWQATVSNRVHLNTRCPFCFNNRFCRSNSMAATHPALAEQWHPTKNGDLTPFDVRALTRTKIWWQCVVDPTHIWCSAGRSRVEGGSGCGRCAASTPKSGDYLVDVNPEVAAQWHPTLNEPLRLATMARASNKSVWWQCPTDPAHVWRTRVKTRAVSGCPECAPGGRPQTSDHNP